MIVGSVFALSDATIGASEFFNMQAPTGNEVVIHNITVNTTSTSSQTDLEFYDGTNSFIVDTLNGSGSWMGMFLHCTETQYYRVNPTDATNTKICCDGIVTR